MRPMRWWKGETSMPLCHAFHDSVRTLRFMAFRLVSQTVCQMIFTMQPVLSNYTAGWLQEKISGSILVHLTVELSLSAEGLKYWITAIYNLSFCRLNLYFFSCEISSLSVQNRKVYCDVPHSLTAFGSCTFSRLRNAYNIYIYWILPADIFRHGHWNEIESFQDWCSEIVWSKSPKSQGLFFEMVWCIITIYILWCLSASSARELESEAVVQQLNSTHVNFDHVQSELTGLLIQFRAISMSRFQFFCS